MILFKKLILLLMAFTLMLSCETAEVKENNHNLDHERTKDPSLKDVLRQSDGRRIIPQKYKSIFISNFLTTSDSSTLTSLRLLQERVRFNFANDPRLAVYSKKENSDVILLGRVDRYREIPVVIDNLGRINKYKIYCEVSILAMVNPSIKEEVLLETRKVRFDIFYSPRGQPFEDKYTAQERLFNGLGRRVLLTVFNGWYSSDKTVTELNYDPNASDTTVTEQRNDLSYEERKKIEDAKKNK